MDKEVKQMQSENVRQKTRIAAGAWVDGESLQEHDSATMSEANSDHGNFEKDSAIDKSNA